MTEILVFAVALLWLIGACIRIYRQTHYYQLEEYMSRRYLRWLAFDRTRWLPNKPMIAWFVGAALGFMLSEWASAIVPGTIALISAGVAVWPPRIVEVKKPFRRTARATRSLIIGFIFATIFSILALIVTNALPLGSLANLRFSAAGFFGLLIFLAAPFILIVSNILMTPVEALFRRRFIQQAREVLAEIHPTVIGITGSYGKTSTKVYLAQILSGRYRVLATPKSYNTLMGVSLTINNQLAGDYSIEYFITEMGAYVEGEIAEICDLTQPMIGVVVEVGPQHLERFGSLENTAKAKYEIIKGLPPDGVGVFNWDNPFVREMYERRNPQTRLAVSKTINPSEAPENGPRFIASNIQESLDGLRFNVIDVQTAESQPFATVLLGQHNVTNILLATAVAVHEGMSLKDVARRVQQIEPAESRLVRQKTEQGITIINDAYSANPVGAKEALRVLGMHTGGKRLLITPGMVELGILMESENRKLGETAAQYASDVILVGTSRIEPIKAGLLDAGFPAERLQVVDTLAESVNWYKTHLQSGDTVLFLNDLPDTY
jgi:UDP-N-acetylmuramoyl-tripeptide--D-alanyl-D-alanine ligase